MRCPNGLLETRRSLFALVACLPLCALGCGGGEETTAPEGGEQTGTENTNANGGTAAAASQKPPGQWFDGIPNDVWYPEPLAVAADGRPAVGGGAPATGGETLIAGPPDGGGETPEPAAGGGGGLDWGKTIPADVVDAEVTAIRNRLKQSLVSTAQYNSSYLSLMPHIQTMAVMAAIAADHPGEIRWKENALVIRDLAAKMGAEKLMSGPKAKKQVEEPYLQIEDTLAGSPPADLDTPDPAALFSDVAEMSELMKRLDIAFEKRVSIEIGSADSLKEKANVAKHEGGIIAALGQAIVLEGYGFVDDDEFKGYAQPMIDAGRQIVEASESGDFDKFDAAKTAIRKACTDCHRSYR